MSTRVGLPKSQNFESRKCWYSIELQKSQFRIKELQKQLWYYQKNIYRIVASTNTCYYSENQVFGVLQFEFYVVKGGATNRDMSLTETC